MNQLFASNASAAPFLGSVSLDSLTEEFNVESLLRQIEESGKPIRRQEVSEYLNDVLLRSSTVRVRVPNGDEDLCEIDVSETQDVGGGAVAAVANVVVATQVAAVLHVAAVIAQVTMLVAWQSHK